MMKTPPAVASIAQAVAIGLIAATIATVFTAFVLMVRGRELLESYGTGFGRLVCGYYVGAATSAAVAGALGQVLRGRVGKSILGGICGCLSFTLLRMIALDPQEYPMAPTVVAGLLVGALVGWQFSDG